MNIKKIRETAMLTQPEFAEELGVSFRTIQSWEQGKCKPSLRHRRIIVAFCNTHKIDLGEQR